MEVMDRPLPISEREWEELLDNAVPHIEEKNGSKPVSLAVMLNDYQPVENHPNLFTKRPKLRQRLEMARKWETLQGKEMGEADSTEAMVDILRHCCYVQEHGEMRQATKDDLLDELDDAAEVYALGSMLTGNKGGAEADPLATQTTEASLPQSPTGTDGDLIPSES